MAFLGKAQGWRLMYKEALSIFLSFGTNLQKKMQKMLIIVAPAGHFNVWRVCVPTRSSIKFDILGQHQWWLILEKQWSSFDSIFFGIRRTRLRLDPCGSKKSLWSESEQSCTIFKVSELDPEWRRSFNCPLRQKKRMKRVDRGPKEWKIPTKILGETRGRELLRQVWTNETSGKCDRLLDYSIFLRDLR